MARILLVDDHQVIMDGLKHLLESAGHEVIAGATDIKKSKSMLQMHAKSADVLLLDLQLPDGDGADLCEIASEINPALNVIALSMMDDPQTAFRFLKKGGRGFISKTEDFRQVLTAIMVAQTGGVYLNESMKPLVLNQLSRPTSQTGKIHGGMLTKREKEVLILIKKEHTVPQISKALNIAESTVISHRKALLSKLQAKNTAGLINAIYKYNLLD